MQLSDMKPSENIKILIYGESGSGKTCFASRAPGPVWFADFDGKVNSAAQFLKGDKQLEQITYDDYVPKGDLPADRFNNELERLQKLATAGDFPYKTIVLDSLTTFCDESMKYLIKSNPGIKRTVTRGVQVPALQDYGMFRIFMKQTLMAIPAMPCNVIVTAHIQIEKDENTGEILRTPMMPGKLARELPIYFAEVYRSFVKDGVYCAQTKSDSKYQCRTQLGLKPEISLDYKELLNA